MVEWFVKLITLVATILTAALQCDALATLIVVLLTLLTNNVEELQAVLALACAHHPKPITKLLLLEELLRQILQVPPAKLLMCHDFDATIAEVRHVDGVT